MSNCESLGGELTFMEMKFIREIRTFRIQFSTYYGKSRISGNYRSTFPVVNKDESIASDRINHNNSKTININDVYEFKERTSPILRRGAFGSVYLALYLQVKRRR